MKRGLKIVTGLVVLLSMVFLSGFITHGGKARAMGGEPPISPARLAEMQEAHKAFLLSELDALSPVTAKASAYYIGDDAEITKDKTFYKDVFIDIYGGLSIQGAFDAKKPTVTIYGNLIVLGELNVYRATLKVYGAIYIYNHLEVFDGKIIVDKYRNSSKGSQIIIDASYQFDFGIPCASLEVYGNSSITINSASSSMLLNYTGSIEFDDKTTVTVNGKFYEYGYHSYYLSGHLIINGDFYQDCNMNTSPDFYFTLKGTPAKPREVIFFNPATGHFRNLSLDGVVFTETSLLSIYIDKNLTQSFNCEKAGVVLSGNLEGSDISITSAFVELIKDANLTMGGGKLTVNGPFFVDYEAMLIMNNDNDTVIVNGDVFACSRYSNGMMRGRLVVNGDFFQCNSGSNASYKSGPDFTTEIRGSDRYVYFESPDASYITNLVLGEGASLNPASIVSLNSTLQNDLELAGSLYIRGDLNGHGIYTEGDVTVLNNTAITISGGILAASGDLTVSGNLVMNNHNDLVVVGGDFIANGTSSVGKLTDGRLRIFGDFSQSGDTRSFCASGSHTTVFAGDNPTIRFAEGSNSKFAYLSILNETIELPAESRYERYVNTGTKLGSIDTGGVGTFYPDFNRNKRTYMLLLPIGTDSVTLTPNPLSDYGSNVCMSISSDGGQTYQDYAAPTTICDIPKNGSKTVVIQVYALNDVYNSREQPLMRDSYIIKVETINPDLGALNLPYGSYIDPPFDPNITDYSVELPETAVLFLWAPTTDHPDSSLRIFDSETECGASITIDLPPDPETHKSYRVVVTAQDGIVTKEYNITFTRRNPVAAITLSTGSLTPAFNKGIAAYTVNVPVTAASVTVNVIRSAAPADCSAIRINGEERDGDRYTLQPPVGGSATATIDATDADGKSVTTYTVTVNRAKLISNITTSAGTLTPAFDPMVQDYTVDVAATVSQVKITPVKMKTGVKTLYINGKKANYAYAKPPVGGSATLTVKAVATDGKSYSEYRITVRRSALITDIGLTGGLLAFDPAKSKHSVDVSADVSSVTLSVTRAPASVRSISINGTAADSKLISLPKVGGQVTATVTATATDKKTKSTYYITINRGKIISGIGVAGGKLSPSFSPTVTAYSVSVPATTTQVTLTPQGSAECTGISAAINGEAVSSVPIVVDLDFGETKTVTVTGKTAAGTTAVYTVKVSRAALVTGIKTNLKSTYGKLTPSFSAKTKQYDVTLLPTTASVTIYATKAKSGVKWMTINDKKVTSLKVSPKIGEKRTIKIKALSSDGTTPVEYTINITRLRMVDDIEVSGDGYPTLDFDPVKTSYIVDIPADAKTVTVTPKIVTDNVKSLTMDGKKQSYVTLMPPVCGSSSTTIAATAKDSKTKISYKVTVQRAPILTGIAVQGAGGEPLTVSPAFSPTTANYTVTVPATVSRVTLTPGKGAECALLEINGTPQDSITLDAPALGASLEPIAITGRTAAGTEITYTVTLKRVSLVANITAASMTPTYDPTVTDYEIDNVPATTSSVKISVKKGTGVGKLTINGVSTTTYTAKPPIGGTIVVPVVATAKDGKAQSTYNITITRQTLLTDIQVSGEGSPALGSPFNPTDSTYYVDIPADTQAVTVTPVKLDANVKSLTIDGKAVDSKELKTPVGGSVKATIVATAKDGKTKSTYYVTVRRAAIISGINVTGGKLSPAFSATNAGPYKISVPATQEAPVEITPVLGADCALRTINGEVADSIALDLAPGDTRNVTVEGRTAAGTTSTYSITVSKASLVASISSGTKYKLSPAFNTSVHDYTVSLPSSASSVTITVKKGSGVKKLTINGKSFTSSTATYTAKPPMGGCVYVNIVATATDNVTQSAYTVQVFKGVTMTNIRAEGGTLSPAFNPATRTYSVELPATQIESVFLQGVPAPGYTCVNSLTGDSNPVPVLPAPGDTQTVIFTSGGVAYTVHVHRAGMLAGLTLTNGSDTFALTPAFDPDTNDYDAVIPAGCESVVITPEAVSGCVYYIVGSAAGNTPHEQFVELGESYQVEIECSTASDPDVLQTYTVNVHRAPLLTNILVSAGSLNFDADTREYTVRVGPGTESIDVSAAVTAGCEYSVSSAAENNTPGSLAAPIGGTATVTIHVWVAGNPSVEDTYTVTMQRYPALSGLTVTNGELGEPVSLQTFDYTVTAGSADATVTLEPVGYSGVTYSFPDFPEATTALDVSRPEDGDTLVVSIEMEGENGLTVAYSVTVNWPS